MAEVLAGGRAEELASLRAGTRLGRYELLVPVARGGMARVWAAREPGFQELVAIKTILPHLVHEPRFERMFLDEARIASGVHHPNVCEIYELGEEAGTLYLAMEWVFGDSLSRILSPHDTTEALDPRTAARIVADACAGIHAAHELTDEAGRSLDVVHRDVSPHNLLITSGGASGRAGSSAACARRSSSCRRSRSSPIRARTYRATSDPVTDCPFARNASSATRIRSALGYRTAGSWASARRTIFSSSAGYPRTTLEGGSTFALTIASMICGSDSPLNARVPVLAS